MAIRATGAAEIAALAERIRAAGESRKVAPDIAKGLRSGRKQIRNAFRTHARAVLPHSGGLNRWVASSSFKSPVVVSARTARMKIKVGRDSMSGRADLEGLDDGLVIHPLFGKRRHWYDQGVPPKSISEPILDEGEKQLQQAVIAAANNMVARIG